MFDEQLDDVRIKVVTRAPQQKRDRFVARHAATKRTIFPDRIKTIDYRNDPRRDWYLLALQTVRIPESVPLLVMMTHYGRDGIREVNAAEYLRADRRVDFHLFKLGRGQAAGFVDDVRGHSKLANVVQQGAGSQRGDFDVTNPDLAQSRGVDLHARTAMRRLVFASIAVASASRWRMTRLSSSVSRVFALRRDQQCDRERRRRS